jgi:hypothetical protein
MDCPKKDCLNYLAKGYTHRNCFDCGSDFLNYETENFFSKRTEQEYDKKFFEKCINTGININDLDKDERYRFIQKLSRAKRFIHFCVTNYMKNYETDEETSIEYLDIVMNTIEKEQFRIGISETDESQRGNL